MPEITPRESAFPFTVPCADGGKPLTLTGVVSDSMEKEPKALSLRLTAVAKRKDRPLCPLGIN